MRDETDPERSDNSVKAAGEEKWNDWHKSADCSRNPGRQSSTPLIWKSMLGETELALGHRLHELLRLLREALRHFLRFFRREPLQLIEERHLFNFFLRIFLDLGALTRDFRFVHFPFAFCCEIRACAHRQRGGEHPRETGN